MSDTILSEVFWVSFVGSVIGCIIAVLKMCYKSKCKEVSLCCLKVVRDVEGEEKADEAEAVRQQQINRTV